MKKSYYTIYFHTGITHHTIFDEIVIRKLEHFGFSTEGIQDFISSDELVFFGNGFNITRKIWKKSQPKN